MDDLMMQNRGLDPVSVTYRGRTVPLPPREASSTC
jgi:hypothetical protein